MESMEHTAAAPIPPGTIAHPDHGTWEGHVLPGSFFIIWSLWWLWGIFRLYFKTSTKKPYKSRSWYDLPGPGKHYPVEPILKVLLPFIGANLELWAGHVSYRRMYDPVTGHFEVGNLQDWQHAAMYAAFMASGAVDLIGYYTPQGTLPAGSEHGFLGLALVVEGLLFAFHLKGTELDWKLHFLLVLVVLLAGFCCFAEMQYPQSLLLSVVRAQLVLLQGIWFCQIAQILFRDNMAWDPNYHGSIMMVPFFFVMWLMLVAFTTLIVFVGVSLYKQRTGQTYRPVKGDEEAWAGTNGHSSVLEFELEPSSSAAPRRD